MNHTMGARMQENGWHASREGGVVGDLLPRVRRLQNRDRDCMKPIPRERPSLAMPRATAG